MIVLPSDWRQITGGALAIDVVANVPVALRGEFQRLWVRTLLDFVVNKPPSNDSRILRLEAVAGLGWRINSLLYAYFPDVNDDALEQCQEANGRWEVFAIVPEDYQVLFKSAVKAVCPRRPPSVMSVQDFTSWRFVLAKMDYRRGMDELLPDFARRFNRRLNELNCERFNNFELELPKDVA